MGRGFLRMILRRWRRLGVLYRSTDWGIISIVSLSIFIRGRYSWRRTRIIFRCWLFWRIIIGWLVLNISLVWFIGYRYVFDSFSYWLLKIIVYCYLMYMGRCFKFFGNLVWFILCEKNYIYICICFNIILCEKKYICIFF